MVATWEQLQLVAELGSRAGLPHAAEDYKRWRSGQGWVGATASAAAALAAFAVMFVAAVWAPPWSVGVGPTVWFLLSLIMAGGVVASLQLARHHSALLATLSALRLTAAQAAYLRLPSSCAAVGAATRGTGGGNGAASTNGGGGGGGGGVVLGSGGRATVLRRRGSGASPYTPNTRVAAASPAIPLALMSPAVHAALGVGGTGGTTTPSMAGGVMGDEAGLSAAYNRSGHLPEDRMLASLRYSGAWGADTEESRATAALSATGALFAAAAKGSGRLDATGRDQAYKDVPEDEPVLPLLSPSAASYHDAPALFRREDHAVVSLSQLKKTQGIDVVTIEQHAAALRHAIVRHIRDVFLPAWNQNLLDLSSRSDRLTRAFLEWKQPTASLYWLEGGTYTMDQAVAEQRYRTDELFKVYRPRAKGGRARSGPLSTIVDRARGTSYMTSILGGFIASIIGHGDSLNKGATPASIPGVTPTPAAAAAKANPFAPAPAPAPAPTPAQLAQMGDPVHLWSERAALEEFLTPPGLEATSMWGSGSTAGGAPAPSAELHPKAYAFRRLQEWSRDERLTTFRGDDWGVDAATARSHGLPSDSQLLLNYLAAMLDGEVAGGLKGAASTTPRPFTRTHIHVGPLTSSTKALVAMALENPALASVLAGAGFKDASTRIKLQVEGLASPPSRVHVIVDDRLVDVGNHLSAAVAIPRACALLLYLLRTRGDGLVCGVNLAPALDVLLRPSATGAAASRRTGVWSLLDDE